MKKSDRKKLEYRVNEKLIAMVQTMDLDRIYIFLADLTETLTSKQLEAIDSVIADYGFNNFEGYYKPQRFETIDKKTHVITKDNMTSDYYSRPKN
tara:strand:- start:270 stop:554 length:285 start_codon:yes stop_codon:yes gene_type:complete